MFALRKDMKEEFVSQHCRSRTHPSPSHHLLTRPPDGLDGISIGLRPAGRHVEHACKGINLLQNRLSRRIVTLSRIRKKSIIESFGLLATAACFLCLN